MGVSSPPGKTLVNGPVSSLTRCCGDGLGEFWGWITGPQWTASEPRGANAGFRLIWRATCSCIRDAKFVPALLRSRH